MKEKITSKYDILKRNAIVGNRRKNNFIIRKSSNKVNDIKNKTRRTSGGCSGCNRRRAR